MVLAKGGKEIGGDDRQALGRPTKYPSCAGNPTIKEGVPFLIVLDFVEPCPGHLCAIAASVPGPMQSGQVSIN